MSKVYLVSSGSYSDYKIEKAFSTKKKAQKFIKFYKKIDEDINDFIKEFEVDDFYVDNFIKRKIVTMEIDGNGAYVYETIYLLERTKNEKLKYIDCYGNSDSYYWLSYGNMYEEIQLKDEHFICFVNADYDDQKAIKVANEKRIQFLLNNNEVKNEI